MMPNLLALFVAIICKHL